MIYLRHFIATTISVCICFLSTGQTVHYALPERVTEYTQEIVPENFDTLLFRDALLYFINKELKHLGHRTLKPEPILCYATQPYAEFIAYEMDAKTGLGGKKQQLNYRLSLTGGSVANTEEIVAKFSIAKGKTKLYYDSVALAAVYKWSEAKQWNTISDETLLMCGIGAMPDEEGKKIYISLLLGNYSSINKGKTLVQSNPTLTTSTNYKLLPYDAKICKATNKIKNINRFQSDLSVDQSGVIYFETDEFKLFSKLLKEPLDGIAVDILSRSQFSCESENITDHSLPSTGYMLKPVYQNKIPKLNLVTGKEAKQKCKIPLGAIPQGLSDYELNLLVIQDKHACASIHKTFSISGETKDDIEFEILADTITAFNTYSTHYIPEPDTTILEFRIPFELGKSDYNPEDIKPFIDALNEPEFIVYQLKITAYSSIEGEEGTNERLREMRAGNIFKAFQKMNPSLDNADIISADSWSIFTTDIRNTKYDTLASMSRKDAVEYIKQNHLADSLEYILSKHRFADIKMVVIYDISGVKERAFVLKKFENALLEGNLTQALSIEKFMMHKIVRKQYPPKIVHDINIPKDSARFTGMEMNRLWLEYHIEKKDIDTAFYHRIQHMYSLSPQNDYIRFNNAFCKVLFDTITDESQIDVIQREIDALLTSTLSKERIDPLNLKFQLNVLNSINETFEPQDEKKLVASILEKVKTIVELNDDNWEQALSLSYLFIDMKDYEYACEILEPFIRSGAANETITFTYLACCSNIKNKYQTEIFSKAVESAIHWNKDRLCTLLKDQFSLIVLENPNIKSVQCANCE